MAATYNHHNYQYGQRLYQSQAQQQQSQHRRYPSTPGLGVGLEGYPTRHQHVHDLRAQAASPALSTSSYEHIVFGVGAESDDDVVVYRPHASTSRSVHHVRSPSAPTFSTTSSTLASPSAPTPVSRHAPAPRPAPTFQLRMIPWSDDRSDLESDAGSTDEILFPSWGISLPRPPFREDDTFSEATTEDNVLFSRPRSRANWADDVDAATNGTGVDGIESALANLNMAECSSSRVQSPTPPPSPGRKKKRHHHHHRRVRSDGASTSQAAPSKQSPATPKAKAGKLKPVVPEEDEVPDMPSSEALSAAYEEAARYITYFLSNPAKQHSKSAQLAFLQALIIELGLYQPPTASLPTPPSSPASSSPATPSPPAAASPPTESGSPPPLASMPSTLTSARAALKSRAFVSIREYLHARTNGRDAIAATVHPSRSSLRRALQDKGERIVRGKAKESGLGVLLVTCHYH